MESALAEENERLRSALATQDKVIEGLQARLRELEKSGEEGQTQQSIPSTRHPANTNGEVQEFRFLDLPIELRTYVYELCLVKGTVFPKPRTKYDPRYKELNNVERPEWQLLAVSHLVRHEAAKVLLSKNHFVLSYHCSKVKYFLLPWPGKDWLLCNLRERYLRSVSITLDLRSIADDSLAMAEFVRYSGREPIGTIYEEIAWTWGADLKTSANLLNLKFLQVDTTNSYCPHGHRLDEQVVEAIRMMYKHYTVPEVEVLGTKTTDERAIILAAVLKELHALPTQRRQGILRFKTYDIDYEGSHLTFHSVDEDETLGNEDIDLAAVDDISKLESSGADAATITAASALWSTWQSRKTLSGLRINGFTPL